MNTKAKPEPPALLCFGNPKPGTVEYAKNELIFNLQARVARLEAAVPVAKKPAKSPLDDDDWNALGWICEHLEDDEPGMHRRLLEIMEKLE